MALSSCQLVVIDIWLKPLVSGWMNRSQVKGRSIGDAIDCFILRFYLINGNDAVDFVSFFSISIFIHIWNVGQGRTFCIRIIQHWKLLNRLPHQGRRKCIDYSWFIDENNSKFYKSKQWTLLSQQSRLHLRVAVFSNFFLPLFIDDCNIYWTPTLNLFKWVCETARAATSVVFSAKI